MSAFEWQHKNQGVLSSVLFLLLPLFFFFVFVSPDLQMKRDLCADLVLPAK